MIAVATGKKSRKFAGSLCKNKKGDWGGGGNEQCGGRGWGIEGGGGCRIEFCLYRGLGVKNEPLALS